MKCLILAILDGDPIFFFFSLVKVLLVRLAKEAIASVWQDQLKQNWEQFPNEILLFALILCR